MNVRVPGEEKQSILVRSGLTAVVLIAAVTTVAPAVTPQGLVETQVVGALELSRTSCTITDIKFRSRRHNL